VGAVILILLVGSLLLNVALAVALVSKAQQVDRLCASLHDMSLHLAAYRGWIK